MTRKRGWTILAALVCLAFVATAWAGEKKKVKEGERDPAWFACSTLSDCTVTEGLCGSPAGVNLRHLKAYERWVANRQARIRCAGGIQVFRQALVACQEGACSAGAAPGQGPAGLRAGVNGECSLLSDCVISHSVCGEPLGIPAKKRKAWEKDVRRRAVAVDCPGPVTRPQRAVLACEQQRCVGGPVPEGGQTQPSGPVQETKAKGQ